MLSVAEGLLNESPTQPRDADCHGSGPYNFNAGKGALEEHDGEHEKRPVPEIERVADLAEEAQRLCGEKACRPARRGTSVEQCNGPGGGEEGGEPRVRHLRCQCNSRNGDRGEASPRDAPRASRGAHHADEGEQTTDPKLPDTRWQQVEGARRRGIGEPEAERE